MSLFEKAANTFLLDLVVNQGVLGQFKLNPNLVNVLSEGNTFGQINRIYKDVSRTITSTPQVYNFTSGLTDINGNSIALSRIVTIIVINRDTTNNYTNRLIGGGGTNPLINTSFQVGPGDGASLGAGYWIFNDPNFGLPVSAGSADRLTIQAPATGSVLMDLLVLGRQ